MSGFADLNKHIEADFYARHPKFNRHRGRGLCLLVTTMLEARSGNLMELASCLPRSIAESEKRYQYIERHLSNERNVCDEIMLPYILDVVKGASRNGETVVIAMDQSHINSLNEVLMLSIRVGGRAMPLLWRVRETQGNIGFSVQEGLLNAIFAAIPPETKVLLCADRFYGTAALINWCQKANWSYRIRLKGNLTLQHEGGEMTTLEAFTLLPKGVENAELYGTGIKTNIGFIHEKGHKEAWIIAMDTKPSHAKVLDYGLRWCIEAMFSDFKSRGFGLMQSKIRKPDRMERLILVMAIALYVAVAQGIKAKQTQKK